MQLHNSQKILLVEDNEHDEFMTVRALKKCRVSNEIDVVRDGAEAVDYLLRRGDFSEMAVGDLPALVLLDLKLPKLNGIEVLEALRANAATRHTPVVVMTSSAEEQDVADSYSFGCNSYIQKPVDFDKFMYAIEQLGVYWLLLNRRAATGHA